MHPFRQHVAEFTVLVKPLSAAGQWLAGAEGYYCAELDAALLVLRFHRTHSIGQMLAFAQRSGLPLVVPELLPPAERRRFYLQQLTRHQTYVQQYPSTSDPTPLVERVLRVLSQHVSGSSTASSLVFDVERDLPIYTPAGHTAVCTRADTQVR